VGSNKSYPGQVRIVAGKFRGRRLQVIDSPGFRPTPDRVKETVFNWLQPYLPGSRCLDLFAGSGALCLESLSRGADAVTMVEKSSAVAKNLQKNIDSLGADDATLVNTDALQFLVRTPTPFDIVFVDPPFSESALINQCLHLLQGGWLRSGGLVYVEASSDFEDLQYPAEWKLLKNKKAGQVGYYLLQAN